ncbi:MAG: hypothetical protein M3Z04_07375 [Chloroflexota bacterium]|nr:hypothetical protein [Chloroflexota bacterium]
MKTTKPNTPTTTDPWQALAQAGPLQVVPLEGVLARLQCTGRAAGVVRQELLTALNRVTADGPPRDTGRPGA